MTEPAERAIVLVLSGGGAKTAAHAGAMRALEERRLVPTRYVGTSMGAVFAASFAAGLSADDVLERVRKVRRGDVASPSASLLLGPLARALLRSGPLRRTIERLVPARRFAELHRPLSVTATDIDSGEQVLFGAGGDDSVPLIDALYASCALPVYYRPAELAGRRLVDGGLRSVLPLDIAFGFQPDLVVGVSVGPSFSAAPPASPEMVPPMLRAHNYALRVMMAAQTEREVARWRDGHANLVLIEPHQRQQSTFAVETAAPYVEAGYRAARDALEAVPRE